MTLLIDTTNALSAASCRTVAPDSARNRPARFSDRAARKGSCQ